MKRILFLLLLTVSVYGQNPSRFAKIQITGNSNSGTATKVNVQEANGDVNTQTINTGFNKNIGLGGSDVVGANTLLNQYATTPVDWTETAFNSGQVVFYGGKQWISKIATVAGDVPAASSKWEEITFDALANKTTTVDQTIIDGSTNSVSGNAVFDGLALKSNIGHTHVASQITDLSKASVGLGNVDNTSDLSKPLSTATINALATKFPTPTGLTANYLTKWNGSGFVNSLVYDNDVNIGIGTILPSSKFEVNSGDIKMSQVIGLPSTAGYGLTFRNVFNSNNYDAQIVCRTNAGGAATSGLLFRTGYFNGSIATQADRMYIDAETGNVIIGTTTDNLVAKLQVNGNITASPATTANQVVVKSQLDAVAASSGSYTPTVSASTNCVSPSALPSTYTKNGNIVTLRLNVLAANFTAANTFTTITVNLPVNRTLTNIKNIGSGSGFNTFGEYWVAIAQTGANNNTVSVSFRTPSTSTGNITLFVQYDITQ